MSKRRINKIYTFRLIVIAPLGACIMPAGGGGIGTGGGNLWSPRERGAMGGGGGHGGGGGGGGTGATGSVSCDDGIETNISDVTLSELLRGLVAVPFRRLAAERSDRRLHKISLYTAYYSQMYFDLASKIPDEPFVSVPVRVSSSIILFSRTLCLRAESCLCLFKAASSSSTNLRASKASLYSTLVAPNSVSSSANFDNDSLSNSAIRSWACIKCNQL